MAYTLDQFLTAAQAGNAVKLTKAGGNFDLVLHIGSTSIQLSESAKTVTVTNGVKTEVLENTSSIDLGTLFTANQVLESRDLRQAIIDSQAWAEAGTVSLSRDAVI